MSFQDTSKFKAGFADDADDTDECYCDFESRRFFGCFSEEHAPPCPQAVISAADGIKP